MSLVALVCGVACSSRTEPHVVTPDPAPVAAAPVAAAPPVAASAPPVASVAADAATPTPPPASPNGDVIVVAHVTDAGPIGDGRCSQRSYEIAIDRVVAGTVDAPKDKRWVHFEQCGAARQPPPAGDLAGTGLAVGSTYQLTLRAGASPNFGTGLMILAARAP